MGTKLAVLCLAARCLATAGCGRLHFEPITDDGHADDSPSSGQDGSVGSAGTCAGPVDLAFGTPLANQSIAGATQTIDSLAACRGLVAVYRLTLASMTSGTLDLSSDFDGALEVNTTCAPIPLCQSFTQAMPYSNQYAFSAGATYILVWKSSGSGTTFSIAAQ